MDRAGRAAVSCVREPWLVKYSISLAVVLLLLDGACQDGRVLGLTP